MEKFDNYLTTILQNDQDAQGYINAALEVFFVDHNKELFLVALNKVIRANGGITKIAKKTNINRQHLYRMLSARGNPTFDNIGFLLSAIGFKLKVEAYAAWLRLKLLIIPLYLHLKAQHAERDLPAV